MGPLAIVQPWGFDIAKIQFLNLIGLELESKRIRERVRKEQRIR
jgi:hypothetical protein